MSDLRVPKYSSLGNILDLTPTPSGKTFFGDDLNEEMADDYYRFFLGLRVLEMYRLVSSKPDTLFIEPHNGCQLRCRYCYAETWHHEKGHYIDPSMIADLYQKYKFSSVMIYGGDIFYDWEIAKKVFAAVKGVDTIFISTNGMGLTPERVAFIKEHCNRFEVQLSVEPREWDQRITQKADVHQNQALKNLHKVTHLINFVMNVTIPAQGLKKWSPLSSYFNEFNDLLGTDKWVAGWQMQDMPAIPVPPWATQWMQEEWYDAQEKDYDLPRSMKGIASVGLSHLIPVARSNDKLIPAYYFNCNAGMGSIAIGPDNRLYSCHEKAVAEDNGFHINDATPRGLYGLMKNKINNMDNPLCTKCPAHYTCGGICFAYLSSVRCDYERLRLPLSFYVASKLYPNDLIEMARKQRSILEKFKSNYEVFKRDVRSKTWHDMVSGALPVEQVAALAERWLGISSHLDTPLWELPGLGTEPNAYRALTA
jgi:radical SAM protein with 4Fe4S-binding SPASM domain